MKRPTLVADGSSLPWTGERFIPGLAGEIEFEHVHRYLFAAQFCQDKEVLDVASGEGYGSNILASSAKSVIGVDVAEDAVAHASAKYVSENLTFRLGMAQNLPVEDNSIDVVVSFETLEHIDEHEKFLSEIKRVLKPGGILVMSTPDKNVYMADEHNHFHLKELDRDEFRDLIAHRFQNQSMGFQKALAGSVILSAGIGGRGGFEVFSRPDRSTFSASPLPRDAAYFVVVASDAELPDIRWGLLDDAQYLRHLQERLDSTQTWVSYAISIINADREIINPCLYSHGVGDGFSEETAVRQVVKLRDAPEACVLQSPSYESGLAALRLDFTDADRTFVLHKLVVETLTGEPVFVWDGSADFISAGLRMTAEPVPGGVLVKCGDDPQLALPMTGNGPTAHALRVVLSVSRALGETGVQAHAALDEILSSRIEVLGHKFDAGADLTSKRLSLLEERVERVIEGVSCVAQNVQVEDVSADLRELRSRLDDGQAALSGTVADLGARLTELETCQAEAQSEVSHRLQSLMEQVAPLSQANAALEDVRTQVLRLSVSQTILEKRNESFASDGARSVAELTKSVAELKAQLDDLTRESSAHLERSLAQQSAALAALGKRIEDSAETNQLLLEDVRTQVLRLLASQTILEKRNETLAADGARSVTELTKSVVDLKAQLGDLARESSAHLERSLAQQSAALAALGERIADSAETNRLLLEAAARKARLDLLESEIGVEGGTLRDARSAVRRLKANEQRAASLLAEIYNSTSWKITAPIRAFKTLIKTGRLPEPPQQIVPAIATVSPGSVQHSAVAPIPHERSLAAAPAAAADPSRHDDPRPPAALEAIDPTPITTQPPLENPAVKLVAFYLPQFHPIPENDAWWGKGFTEWTNVTRAHPRFDGHYQPHLPSDLGFYDLRLPEVQERQVELAKLYGVGAFCFYFYWFAGKRLLETPIQQFAQNPNIDFPFCLCWANENWSRRWDGLESEVLIGQEHSAEDDIAFITHVSQYLTHCNNIRVDGKPLLVIYRPKLLPDPKATAERWRNWCRLNGVGEIYLGYMQSFEIADPADYGFDAAIEFPPNNTAPPIITDQMEAVDPKFSGIVYDYRVYPERSNSYAKPGYTLFRGVFPSWDNEARRQRRGSVWAHSTPTRYRTWLENAARDTISRFSKRDERLVFVNAWNEWAEGAHLEPDQRYGYAWLQATRDALEASGGAAGCAKLALVTHDAYAHGAQFLALNIGRRLVERLGAQLDIVTLGDGPLLDDFAKLGELHSLSGLAHDGAEARALAQALRAKGVEAVLCNTTVSGVFVGALHDVGLRTVCLVHELAGVISGYNLERHAEIISRDADQVVFPGARVRKSFESFARVEDARALLMPQGSFRGARRSQAERDAAADRLRRHLGVAASAKIILAIAYGDRRKGIDIFLATGERVMAQDPDAVFVWVGLLEHTIAPEIEARLAASTYRDRFILPGFASDLDDLYAGADIYAMTSREDPFPMVVLEALQVGTPVVGFEGAGDFDVLLRSGAGLLVGPVDEAPMADAILSLLRDPSRLAQMGHIGQDVIEFDYAFDRYVMSLMKLLKPEYQRVSVIVPNYNYARYLEGRLKSIDQQTVPPYEIIILDDKSTDDSLDVLAGLMRDLKTPTRLLANETNSGSVFKQWRKGVELARGDLVWIAEADDIAEPGLLSAALNGFEDPEVVLSFVQSKQIGTDGEVLAEDYLEYVSDVDSVRWTESYVADGKEEIRTALAIKNTIPNVSAVVFRRSALARVLAEDFDEVSSMRVAGDWVVYIRLLMNGKVAFHSESLNLHRRHTGSVTVSSFNIGQLREIIAVQRLARRALDVPDPIIRRSDAYSQSLYELFGLAKTKGSKWEDDPALLDFINGPKVSVGDAKQQGNS